MFTLKHKFNSPQADGVDPTLVKPSDWNADHDIEASVDGVFVGRPAGAGPGPMQELAFSSILPSGVVVPYAGATAPSGWLLCSGQIVNVATYPNLFAVIGASFGGNGISTFALPDMRGRVAAGIDAGAGRLTVWGSGMGVAGGIQQTQPRVYAIVDVSVNGTLTGSAGANATAGAGSGAGPMCGDGAPVTVSGASVGAGNIRNDGNNVTDVINVAQPFQMMNYIIKT